MASCNTATPPTAGRWAVSRNSWTVASTASSARSPTRSSARPSVSSPTSPRTSPRSPELTVNGKIGLQINWLVVGLAVASLLFASARMALERRAQPGTTAVKGILRMILVAGGSTFVLTNSPNWPTSTPRISTRAGVKEQLKLIAQCGTDSLDGLPADHRRAAADHRGHHPHHPALHPARRDGDALGTLPLAAAASMTEWGTSWWRKHIAWMVAWLIFKPAVGLVLYAGAAMITSSGADSTQQKIAGCGVLLLSAVALPALLRLVVPAAAALGASDGVAGVAAGAATGAAKAGPWPPVPWGTRSAVPDRDARGAARRARPAPSPRAVPRIPESSSDAADSGSKSDAGSASGSGGSSGAGDAAVRRVPVMRQFSGASEAGPSGAGDAGGDSARATGGPSRAGDAGPRCQRADGPSGSDAAGSDSGSGGSSGSGGGRRRAQGGIRSRAGARRATAATAGATWVGVTRPSNSAPSSRRPAGGHGGENH
jgi:uncharacterized membrane protein YgcG